VAKRSAPTLEEIAAEVGRLFGTTEAHARKWLQQRNALLEALHLVRGKATDLIDELTGAKRRQFKRRARAQASRAQLPAGNPTELMQGRKKRRMSAATRAKMRAAAKKRWAEKRKNG
jgi:transcription initiation factor TFIID subunit TAF12